MIMIRVTASRGNFMKPPNFIVMLASDGMGKADDTSLRHKLLDTYLRLLLENKMLPGAICFYTDAVKLVVEGSPVLDLLRTLEKQGVHLIICRTCLNYFNLEDKVRVGIIGGMGDI